VRRGSSGAARPSGSPRRASGVDVERILELVPLATHNQRGRGTLYVGTGAHVDAEDLVGSSRAR
jgi:GTP cyclohydrolase FolE2